MITQLQGRLQITIPTWFWAKNWQQMEKEADFNPASRDRRSG
jgi:hypothetical protein